MSYTVLARRYRSLTFEDIVGQDSIARTLRNAIDADRTAHAYLFCGTRGVGKTSMARIFARELNVSTDLQEEFNIWDDYYDAVHNTPKGTKRIGVYLFNKLNGLIKQL